MTIPRTRFSRAIVAKISDKRERFHELVERSRARDTPSLPDEPTPPCVAPGSVEAPHHG